MIERPFAKLLKDYRKNNNLTQTQLAQLLDVTKSTIVAYEKGTSDPSVIVLSKAAKQLNFSIDELFELPPSKLNLTDEYINYVPKRKKEKKENNTNLSHKDNLIILSDLILKNRRTFEELTMSKKRTDRMLQELTMSKKRTNKMLEELTMSKKRTDKLFEELTISKKRTDRMLEELTMSKKRNDLIYTELKRAINRATQSEDMFLEVSSKLLKILENNNIDSLETLTDVSNSSSNSSNEITATLETNSSSSNNVVNLESYRDDKDFDLEYEQYLTREEDIDNNKYRSIPLSGPVAAGSPREPIECIEGYYNIPTNKLKSHCDYFLLRVDGDSMNKLYEKNDIILVRKQRFSDDGELVVAFLRDYGATFKRYYNNNGNVELHPESTNPIHKTQIYSPDEAFILGVVLGSLREYVD